MKSIDARIEAELGRGVLQGPSVPRRKLAVCLLLALLLFMTGMPRPAGSVVTSEEFAVVETSEDQYAPDIEGDVVVWQDYRNGNADIYGKNLSTGEEFPISVAPEAQQRPKISGNFVVWEDWRTGDGEIFGYDLATGQELRLTVNGAEQRRPDIEGDIVVWEDWRNARWDIFGYDLASDQEREISINPSNKRLPAVSNSTVVWQDDRGGNSDIFGKDLATGQEEFPVSTSPRFQDQAAISGSTVVWRQESSTNYDIFGKDLETGQVFEVTTNPADQWAPRISGEIVVWSDGRNGSADILGKNLATGEEFQIATGVGPQETPALDGRTVVWTVIWEAQRLGEPNYGTWDVRGSKVDPAPAAPTGLEATGTDSGVDLDWSDNAEVDIVGYNIYRGASQDGPYEQLNADGPVGTSFYADTGAPEGVVSYYKVTAVDEAGNESATTAVSGAALAATDITLEVDPSVVNRGEIAALSGRLTWNNGSPLSNKPLVLEKSTAGSNSFSTVTGVHLQTGADGTFVAEVSVDEDTDYQVKFGGETDLGLKSSASPVVQVRVRKTVSLSLDASPSGLKFGQATTLSGALVGEDGAALSGEQVALEHRPAGAEGFTQLGDPTTTDAAGTFTFTGVEPSKNTDYRATFAGDDSSFLDSSASPIRRVNVRVLVSTQVSSKKVKAGRSITITGGVDPAHTGVVIVTIKGRNRSGQTVQYLNSYPLSDSSYSFAYTPPVRGKYTVSVYFPGDEDHLGGKSSKETFKVKKR